jgi:hypothetical protein
MAARGGSHNPNNPCFQGQKEPPWENFLRRVKISLYKIWEAVQ